MWTGYAGEMAESRHFPRYNPTTIPRQPRYSPRDIDATDAAHARSTAAPRWHHYTATPSVAQTAPAKLSSGTDVAAKVAAARAGNPGPRSAKQRSPGVAKDDPGRRPPPTDRHDRARWRRDIASACVDRPRNID